MARGGYREPANPAPVSGPGKLSRRTDGGPIQGAKEIPGGGKYGERKALAEMQSGAPMQGNPTPAMPTPSVPVTPLNAPTQRPDEPITSGMPFGPGSNTPPPVVAGVDEVAAQIRAAYALYPNEDLHRLILSLEEEGRQWRKTQSQSSRKKVEFLLMKNGLQLLEATLFMSKS